MNPKMLFVAVCLTALCAFAQNNESLPASQLIQPEELAKVLQAAGGEKPVVLYVGPHMFYAQAHISGAEFIGPAGKPEGIDKLRSRAKSLSHDALIVIYCGCCPWDHCPNIRPAYNELDKLGFTRLRVLYLATSFGTNWADKGYPVAKGD
jgi:thiosulfate/3-mercaptopyruvate sulfurtransferase